MTGMLPPFHRAVTFPAVAGIANGRTKTISHEGAELIRATALCASMAVLFVSCSTAQVSAPATLVATNGVDCPSAAGADFSNQDLRNANFRACPAGSLRGARFDGAQLQGAVFAGQDLTDASFIGANLGPSEKGPADLTSTLLERTKFAGATMNGTNLTFATIRCADFSDTSLLEAYLGPQQNIVAVAGCRTKFVRATIDVHTINLSLWGRVDFTETDFKNLSPSTFSLAGKDITGAILADDDFTGIDLSGANLTNVDFSRATLTNARFDNAALNGSSFYNAYGPYVSFVCARFYGLPTDDRGTPATDLCTQTPVSADPYHSATLTLATLLHSDFTNATLKSAVLTGANLSSVTAHSASFSGAFLEPSGTDDAASVVGADLSGADFSNAHVNYVRFNNAVLTGAIFEKNSTLTGTDFTGSIMPMARFSGALLQNVTFNNTILQSADFTSAHMQTIPGADGSHGTGSGVSFLCAQLGGADFESAVITAATFQSAVMPRKEDCCTPEGMSAWCGTININQLKYGPVNFPALQANVHCPNGDVARCEGSQWVIPNWQTADCSADHYTTTVWWPPDCAAASAGAVVQFSDAALKQCILETLPGMPSELPVETAASIVSVSCPRRGITSLDGLSSFTHLQTLDLTANDLTNFSLALPSLQKLQLADNHLTSLDVGKTPQLVFLDVSNNQLQSIKGLVAVALKVVDASHNQLTAVDLAVEDALLYADLSNNRLTSVTDDNNKTLKRLTDLGYLDLSHNSITSIGSVASLTGELSSLYLQCNPSFDCASLGIDGTYDPMQTSHCAAFNSQSGEWIVLQHPTCE